MKLIIVLCALISIGLCDSDYPTLLEDPVLPPLKECGLEEGADRIVGGTIAELREFPWMAALIYRYQNCGRIVGLRCAGSLITKRHIVTAAHCMRNPKFEMVQAWLGDWKISTDPDCIKLVAITECNPPVQKINIIKRIVHPKYDKPKTINDVGVAILERDVVYSDVIIPICLPKMQTVHSKLGEILTVSGWGYVSEDATEVSDLKRKVGVPLLANKICLEKLSKPITENNLCVGGEGGKDSCGGDSGGPLMNSIRHPAKDEEKWYLEGTVSWGDDCAKEGYPAAYTKIANFVEWIVEVIKTEDLTRSDNVTQCD